MTVGTAIVLIDGRGCSIVHVVQAWDVVDGQTFTLSGAVWKSLPFTRGNGEIDAQGRPVFRAALPAIGPRSRPYSDLFLPLGWQPPVRREAV